MTTFGLCSFQCKSHLSNREKGKSPHNSDAVESYFVGIFFCPNWRKCHLSAIQLSLKSVTKRPLILMVLDHTWNIHKTIQSNSHSLASISAALWWSGLKTASSRFKQSKPTSRWLEPSEGPKFPGFHEQWEYPSQTPQPPPYSPTRALPEGTRQSCQGQQVPSPLQSHLVSPKGAVQLRKLP